MKKLLFNLTGVLFSTMLFLSSCTKENALTDNDGNISLDEPAKALRALNIIGGQIVDGNLPTETTSPSSPVISFNSVAVNKFLVRDNGSNFKTIGTPFLLAQGFLQTNDVILNAESDYITTTLVKGETLYVKINVTPVDFINYTPYFSIEIDGYPDKHIKTNSIFFDGDKVPYIKIAPINDLRPGIYNCNINLTINKNNGKLTSNTIVLNIILLQEKSAKDKVQAEKYLAGLWKIIRQAPLPGTVVGGWWIMPNYIGNYILFNNDGRTGEDRSIEGTSVPFGYRLVSDDAGRLILDCNDVPLGTGIQGAKYYILVLNSTTMILNELEYFGIGRYGELKREN